MPVAPLIEPYASDPEQLLSLCIWREARGESLEAKIGVGWVVKNRCQMAPAQGFKHDVAGNILHPWAFSSFMQGDPNSTKYPRPDDPSWHESMAAAHALGISDPTFGAVFYYSPPLTQPPHAWGEVEHTVSIGNLNFFKIA